MPILLEGLHVIVAGYLSFQKVLSTSNHYATTCVLKFGVELRSPASSRPRIHRKNKSEWFPSLNVDTPFRKGLELTHTGPELSRTGPKQPAQSSVTSVVS